jgi:hypothetical protein
MTELAEQALYIYFLTCEQLGGSLFMLHWVERKGKEKMMSKIGKDECKGEKKNSFPFIQGDRMDARKNR